MPKFRLPLQHDLKPRDTIVSKDQVIQNGFVEQSQSGILYTKKRPGIYSGAAGAGTAQGTFLYNDIIYHWDSSVTALTPFSAASSSVWNPSTSYSLGGVVFYNNVNWTAVTPVTGEPPSEPNWTTSTVDELNTLSFSGTFTAALDSTFMVAYALSDDTEFDIMGGNSLQVCDSAIQTGVFIGFNAGVLTVCYNTSALFPLKSPGTYLVELERTSPGNYSVYIDSSLIGTISGAPLPKTGWFTSGGVSGFTIT